VVVVRPAYTSLKCSKCQHTCKENRASQAEFKCENCKHEENADVNAAKNILAAGRAVLACGDIRQTAA
jgi:putative transposase